MPTFSDLNIWTSQEELDAYMFCREERPGPMVGSSLAIPAATPRVERRSLVEVVLAWFQQLYPATPAIA